MNENPSRASRLKPNPPDRLLEYLATYDVRVGELALALRDIVLNEAPEAKENLFRGYALSLTYSFTGRWAQGFCHIVVYQKHVNLGFNKGAQLPDRGRLLEGSGRMIRHLRIASADDLKRPGLLRLLRSAIKLSRTELKLRQAPRRDS